MSAYAKNLYEWTNTQENILDDIIYICFQTNNDGYARTLEEAMINKYFSMDVSTPFKKKEWEKKRKDSKLQFSIPRKIANHPVSDNKMVYVRDILTATSGNKTDFMYSVILNGLVEQMMPGYIDGGLKWLME